MTTLEPPLAYRWRSLCDEIQHPDVELTMEEFSALLSVFKLLRAEGHPFDPAVIALMTVLERQAADSLDGFEDDTDTDEDNTDRDIDFDSYPSMYREPVNPGDDGRGLAKAKTFVAGVKAARRRTG